MSTAEFLPLLAPGLHKITLADLRQLCVDAFPLSRTRIRIMVGLEYFVSVFSVNQIKAEVWVDGSFLTEKINPNDCDLVVGVDAERLDYDKPLEHLLTEIIEDHDYIKRAIYCDTYLRFQWPIGHADHPLGEVQRDYWEKTFGTARDGRPKGIALVSD